MKKAILRAILHALPRVIEMAARTNDEIAQHLSSRNGIVQLSLKDGSVSLYIVFTDGHLEWSSGVHPDPDVRILFKTPDVALKFLKINPDPGDVVHFLKNFQVELIGKACEDLSKAKDAKVEIFSGCTQLVK